jgi:hypothetical protein
MKVLAYLMLFLAVSAFASDLQFKIKVSLVGVGTTPFFISHIDKRTVVSENGGTLEISNLKRGGPIDLRLKSNKGSLLEFSSKEVINLDFHKHSGLQSLFVRFGI